MKNPFFFGYGSLVNTATHAYSNAAIATAHDWQRAWVSTAERPFAYLTAVRASGCKIDGLIAEVPDADWVALDLREDGYERIADSNNIAHTHDAASDIAIYAVPEARFQDRNAETPILLSYLDVVLQGYLQKFGVAGAEAFVETTRGWHTPVLNDRAAPHYPRAQVLEPSETSFVDAALKTLNCEIRLP